MRNQDSQGVWSFSEEDCARLQPLLDKMVSRTQFAVRRVCELSDSVEMRIEILQGVCEELGARMREEILQQVDRGEWAARGMATREDMDITVRVDAFAAYHDPTANLLHLNIQPAERLS